jgi:hypothetical protein
LFLKEYGVAYEYLPGEKNISTIADALFRLEIDGLKIKRKDLEEALTLLSGSENNSIINIKLILQSTLHGSSKNKKKSSKSQKRRIKTKQLSPTSLLNTKF